MGGGEGVGGLYQRQGAPLLLFPYAFCASLLIVCVCWQICKLYLYNNEHSLALAHHSSHMRKFADLSRGWGIGEETFEFWSWLARQ